MKIYVASSWRNTLQPAVVEQLRRLRHEVYDFRHPSPGNEGFSWKQVGSATYKHGDTVDAEAYRAMVDHPVAIDGYAADIGALRDCDAVVYVLPCGKSASWEFGHAAGEGKRAFVLWVGEHEPELMFREATICASLDELCVAISRSTSPVATPETGPEEQRRQGGGGDGKAATPALSVASSRASRQGVSGLEGGSR